MPRINSLNTFVLNSITGAAAGEQANYLGATMLFVQTSAPTGWTKDTTLNDYGLRVVSGSVSTGGVLGFSGVLTNRNLNGTLVLTGSIGGTTLVINNIPTHRHPRTGQGATTSQEFGATRHPNPPGTAPYVEFSPPNAPLFGSLTGDNYFPGTINGTPGTTTAHDHTASTSPSVTYASFNFSVKYVDVILATRT
jgi:hypothetical protein